VKGLSAPDMNKLWSTEDLTSKVSDIKNHVRLSHECLVSCWKVAFHVQSDDIITDHSPFSFGGEGMGSFYQLMHMCASYTFWSLDKYLSRE